MGGRPVLVFAHYFGGSGRSWAPLTASLGDRHILFAPDLGGFGGTDPPPGAPGLDAYADQLSALAADRPWIAVGHSMGGKIALWLAARRPAGLQGLVLIAPSPPTPEPMTEADRRKTIDAFGDRDAARAHIEAITDHTLSPPLFDHCVADEVAVKRDAWMWWMQTGSRLDISDRTAGLDVPTLVITGDQDRVMGLKTPFAVAAGLNRAEVRVVAGGGHLVPLEQPGAVAEAVLGFVGGLAGEAR